MVRRRYKKPHRARRKKPIYAKPLFWKSLVLLSLASGTVWLVCFSPILEIKEIEVAGAEKINDYDYLKVIEGQANKKIALFDSKSILLFNIDQVKKDLLARFPQAESVKIEREFPSKIIASVQERRATAALNNGGRLYLIDSEGIAFENFHEEKGLIEITNGEKNISLGEQAIDKDILGAILRMKSEIVATANINLVSAAIATPERINLLTDKGWYIYFNPLKDITDQAFKLVSVMEDDVFEQKKGNLEYIDVRFTRVYLKQKEENQSIPAGEADTETITEAEPETQAQTE